MTRISIIKFLSILFFLLSLPGCGTEVGNPGDGPEENSRSTEPQAGGTSHDIYTEDEVIDSLNSPDGIVTAPENTVSGEEEDGGGQEKAADEMQAPVAVETAARTMAGSTSAKICMVSVTSTPLSQEETGTTNFIPVVSSGIRLIVTSPDKSVYETFDEPFTNQTGLWTMELWDGETSVCKGEFFINDNNIYHSHSLTVAPPAK